MNIWYSLPVLTLRRTDRTELNMNVLKAFAIVVLCALLPSLSLAEYRFVDINPSLPFQGWANDINDNGDILLSTSNAIGLVKSYLLTNQQLIELMPYEQGEAGPWGIRHYALQLNNHCEAVGFSERSWPDLQTIAVVWPDSQQTTVSLSHLLDLSKAMDEVRGINDSGWVVGECVKQKIGTAIIHRAFRWHPDQGFAWLALPVNGHSSAWAINEQGTVAGEFSAGGAPQACIWNSGGQFSRLSSMGTYSTARAINDNNVAAGYMSFGNDLVRACVWVEGIAVNLDTLGGTESYATEINNDGIVVGKSTKANDHSFWPFVWTEQTGMVELPLPAGATSGEAVAINDLGVIVGKYWTDNGVYVAVWEPVP